MKSFFTILLFLALTWFCVYWFGQQNETDRDFQKIPVLGELSNEIFNKRLDIWDYISRGPSVILDNIGIKIDPDKVIDSVKNNLGNDMESIQDIYQKTQ